MAVVVVLTDDGREVWRSEGVEPWHVMSRLTASGNVKAQEIASGIVRAVEDADKIQKGIDPERLSEKVMRLMDEENEVRPASLETLLELQGNADTQDEHDVLELQIIAARREIENDEVRPDGPETDKGGLIGQQPY